MVDDDNKQQQSQVLEDPHIKKILYSCEQMGLNINNLKAQLLDLEKSGKDMDLIRREIDLVAKNAYSIIQRQKAAFQRSKERTKAQSSKSSNSGQQNLGIEYKDEEDSIDTQGLKPYFKMVPPIATYELIELHIFILYHLLRRSRDQTKVENNPFTFNRVGLHDFMDTGVETYTNNLKEFEDLKKIRTDYYKKQYAEGSKEMDKIYSDGWLDDVPDQKVATDYRESRENVRIAMREQMVFLNKFAFIEINQPSLYEIPDMIQKGNEEAIAKAKLKDEIKLCKKGWHFLEWYQHVANQPDQRAVMAYFLSLAMDKNATW